MIILVIINFIQSAIVLVPLGVFEVFLGSLRTIPFALNVLKCAKY